MSYICPNWGVNCPPPWPPVPYAYTQTCFLVDTSSYLRPWWMHQLLNVWIRGFCCSFRVPCEVLDPHDHLRVYLDRLVTKGVNADCPEIFLAMLVTLLSNMHSFSEEQGNDIFFGLNIDNLAFALFLLHMTWILGCLVWMLQCTMAYLPGLLVVWCECCSVQWPTYQDSWLFDVNVALYNGLLTRILGCLVWMLQCTMAYLPGFLVVWCECCSVQWPTYKDSWLFDVNVAVYNGLLTRILGGLMWMLQCTMAYLPVFLVVWCECCSVQWPSYQDYWLFGVNVAVYNGLLTRILGCLVWMLQCPMAYLPGLLVVWCECCSVQWLTYQDSWLFDVNVAVYNGLLTRILGCLMWMLQCTMTYLPGFLVVWCECCSVQWHTCQDSWLFDVNVAVYNGLLTRMLGCLVWMLQCTMAYLPGFSVVWCECCSVQWSTYQDS